MVFTETIQRSLPRLDVAILKIENHGWTFSIVLLAICVSRHRTTKQDLAFGVIRKGVFQIIHRATDDFGFACPAYAGTATESWSEPSLFRQLEQSAIFVGPSRLDTRPGKLHVDRTRVRVR